MNGSYCINKSQDTVFIETAGFSMWPFVKQGEKLIIKKFPIEDLKIGDLILYQRNNQKVCHRLIKKKEINGRYLIFVRGDNSTVSAELITEQMFLGKAISILRKGKMINLTSSKQRLINWLIVFLASGVSRGARIIKPCYVGLRKVIRR